MADGVQARETVMGPTPSVHGCVFGALLALLLLVSQFLAFDAIAQTAEAPATTATSIAYDARLVGDETRMRLVVELDRRTQYEVFTLDRPRRLIVEFRDVFFALPDSPANARHLVEAMRFGSAGEGKGRLVLNLAKPVRVEDATMRSLEGGERHRLIVDLLPDAPEAFAKAARQPDVPAAEAQAAAGTSGWRASSCSIRAMAASTAGRALPAACTRKTSRSPSRRRWPAPSKATRAFIFC